MPACKYVFNNTVRKEEENKTEKIFENIDIISRNSQKRVFHSKVGKKILQEGKCRDFILRQIRVKVLCQI